MTRNEEIIALIKALEALGYGIDKLEVTPPNNHNAAVIEIEIKISK
ncbi:MAG: hypothetical protein LBH44_07570 [Treponema sp.]|nr:hypothetical protein [Treponema sp.]